MARRALLLANGTYDGNGISQLRSPVSCARELGELLARPDVGEFDVEAHFDETMPVQRIVISKFFKAARPGDHQIVHILGHGFKDEHGKLYFGTRDTDLDCIDATAISARYLHERVTESLASQTIIFVDTCYSGAYVNGIMMAGANVIAKDDFVVPGSNGVAIVTSSTSTQLGWEIENDSTYQAVFTKHMIDGIRSGAADKAASGKITLAELFDHVSGKVRDEGTGQQPKTFDFGLGSNVTVTLNPSKPTMVLSQKILDKIVSAEYMRRCDACRDLHDLVAEDHRWKITAIDRLKKLMRDPDDRVRRRAGRELESVYDLFIDGRPEPGNPKDESEAKSGVPDDVVRLGSIPKRTDNDNFDSSKTIVGFVQVIGFLFGTIFLLFVIGVAVFDYTRRSHAAEAFNAMSAAANSAAGATDGAMTEAAPAANAAAEGAMAPADGAMMEAAPAAEGAMTEGSMSDFLEEKK